MEKGCSDAPNLRFYLGRKCLAPSPGWSISQWDDAILSVVQRDSMAINRRYLPEEGWVVEKIKNTAPAGLTAGDRIHTAGHILLCKQRQTWIIGMVRVSLGHKVLILFAGIA